MIILSTNFLFNADSTSGDLQLINTVLREQDSYHQRWRHVSTWPQKLITRPPAFFPFASQKLSTAPWLFHWLDTNRDYRNLEDCCPISPLPMHQFLLNTNIKSSIFILGSSACCPSPSLPLQTTLPNHLPDDKSEGLPKSFFRKKLI